MSKKDYKNPTDDFACGMICAASVVMDSHGESVIAAEILICGGISFSILKRLGNQFDIDNLSNLYKTENKLRVLSKK